MKIGIFYFSATGVTKKYADFIGNELKKLNYDIELNNTITMGSRKKKIDFSDYDACIFGFPVYNGRLPIVSEEWLQTLNGHQTKCSMFFTYGARALEWAHQVTYFLLTKANFDVILSAEFLGSHSFNVAKGWVLAKDRPKYSDYRVAKEFTELCYKRFHSTTTDWNIDLEGFFFKKQERFLSRGPWRTFLPFRGEETCCLCYQCEEECPTNSFNANTGKSTDGLCISCMHCVSICPDHVIKVGDATEIFRGFVKRHNLSDENVLAKQSKILI
jgi:flavodoxin/Pyruvate/2-oxoacid:ferredoxin oxidoreductase delta subunit